MQFYNLKTRSHVEIPESEITKHKMVRATKTGEQTRYAVKATHEGTPLTKFVSKDAYDGLDVKEGDHKVQKPTTKATESTKKTAEKATDKKPAAAKKPAEKKTKK